MKFQLKNLLNLFLLAILTLVIWPSCVGKKKFLNEVEKRTYCDSSLYSMNIRNMDLNREIADLKNKLATKSGESNAFRDVIDKQDEQINRLELEIEQLANQSLNQKAAMDEALKDKMHKLSIKEGLIDNFKANVSQQEEQLAELVAKVQVALPEYNSQEIIAEVQNGKGFIRLSEEIMFKPRSILLKNDAYQILEKIANILLEYPEMDLLVVGHTDTSSPKLRSIEDNWDLSVLRATPIVRSLTKDFGINPNQIIASGKGESKPMVSNETPEGRAKNRRTEIIISPPTDKIIRMIREVK